jgi:ribosomal protein S13
LVKQGFTVEKFGATPQVNERIVEKIVEVPVEKEVYVSNDDEVNKLTDKINQLIIELDLERKKKKDIYGEG